MAEGLIAKDVRLRIWGALIHNPQVIESVRRRCAAVLENPEDAQPGKNMLIRAYGISSKEREILEARGAVIADATCLFVAKIHKIVAEQTDGCTLLFLLGDESHPEVQGIFGYCGGKAYVYTDEEDLQKVFDDSVDLTKNHAVFVQ
jgi:4-hydroxy-3-methylbut-2-enyl diphosphate reductase